MTSLSRRQSAFRLVFQSGHVIKNHNNNKNIRAQIKIFIDLICLSSKVSIVGVIGFVVHHQLVVHEVEAVGARLEGVLHHQVNCLLVQTRELVDVLAGVDTVGNAEPEVEVKCFEVLVTEEVSFNHPELGDWFPSNLELHSGTN